jgi:zinc ribbon protein
LKTTNVLPTKEDEQLRRDFYLAAIKSYGHPLPRYRRWRILYAMSKIIKLNTKECPYCAETIKRRAIICRFCGYDLRTGIPTRPTLAALQEPSQELHTLEDKAGTKSLGCGMFIVLPLLLVSGLILLFVLLGR